MSPPSNGPPLPFYKNFAASAIAACSGELVSLPLDCAKVTLQLQPKTAVLKYKGMLQTMRLIAAEQGPAALYKGVIPGMQRQVLFGGLRIGLYEPVKTLFVGRDHVGDVNLPTKIAAALTTGALGIMVASPTDLVKVRMQAEAKLPAGTPRQYRGSLSAYATIARTEGVAALWTGLSPNIARCAIINAAELASYDQIKQSLLKTGIFKDDVFCHLASGVGAGFFAVTIGSPVDVVKSRMMGAQPGTYSGVLDAFAQTMRKDGPLAFYSGFGPNFARLGVWNVVMFLTLEQTRKLLA